MKRSTLLGMMCGLASLGIAVPAGYADGTTSGTGTCSGTVGTAMLAGNTRLSVNGTLIQAAVASSVFGRAECECKSRDISMRVQLSGGGVVAPADNSGVSMYIGQDNCSDQTQRTTTGALCEKITNANPPGNESFQLDLAKFKSIGPFDIPLPAEPITAPRPVNNTDSPYLYNKCDTNGPQTRTVNVLIGPDASPASCKLPLTVSTSLPTAPTIDSISSGNGGLTVRWSVPTGTAGIVSYQLLCRRKADPTVPVMEQAFLDKTPWYFSSCLNGKLYRRPLTSDAVSTVVERPGLGMGSAAPFPLDPTFRCSDRIVASNNSLDTRIAGLANAQEYEIVVASIDAYGNASPSDIKTATPQDTQSPLNSYCSDTECPNSFGCQAGPGAPSAAGAAGVMALAALGLLRQRRRRMS